MNFWQFLRRWRLSLSVPTQRRQQQRGWRAVPRRKLPVSLGLELLEDRVVPAPLSPSAVLAPNGVTIFNEGDPSAKIQVALDIPSTKPVTIDYAATGGSALPGVDYRLPAGKLTFAPGQTVQSAPLNLLNDPLIHGNVTIQVTLSKPVNATLQTATAVYTIIDTEPLPTVSFQQAAASGPESQNGKLTVVLSAKSGQTVTVAYAVTGGSATAGTDYKPFAGTLTFTPGQTSQTITIPVLDDKRNGDNQTVQVTLSAPANATLGATATATYTIQNNNPAPTVSFQQAAASGPESQDADLMVALSAASDKTVTVSYAAAGGTAVAGTNYTLPQPQTLTFAPGVLTQAIPVHLIGNGQAGPNKTLRLLLSGPANATLGKTTAETFTIIDNEPLPTVSFASASGSGAESQNGKLTAILSAKSVVTVTVAYAVTGGSATAGTDYKPFAGTLTFTPGQTSQTITIPVLDDKRNGDNQTVQVTLSAPANATLGATATATYTIQNNNPAPTVSFQQAAASGPESQDTSLVVTLSAASDKTVTVRYAAAGGTAVAGTNYTLPQPQTLTFAPGVLTQSIPVHLIGNGQAGPNKTLRLLLSAPANATLGKTTAETFTIIDNEPLPTASFQQASASGPESQNGKLTAILSAKSVVTVTVAYAVTGGSATAGTDYKPFAGTLTFTPGQTSQTITIPVLDDKRNGNNQTVQVALSAPANATLGATATATYTIQKNNPAPTVSFQQAAASGPQSEDASPVVTLSAASDKTVTVSYAASGTAVAGTDYTLPFSSVTFAPGIVTQSIPLDLINTGQLGSNKTLRLQLSAPVGATLGKTTAETYTIIDNVPSVGFDLTPPVLTVLTPAPGLITAHNVTVTGTALDAFSGLASLTAAVDGGSAVNVPVATSGAFSFTTQLSLVSTSDGTHTVQLVATDRVGNVASADVSFVLDTTAPVLTLTSPAAGLVTNAASVTVAGQADGHVAGLASLQAQVDGGTPFAVSFDSAGNFSFDVATAALADGTHTVSLSATDKAGNTGTAKVSFVLDLTAPILTLTSPAAGLVTNAASVTVAGQADGRVAGLASLQARVDGGTPFGVSYDGSGNFSFPLSTADLTDGTHTVTLQATDNAGNVSTAQVTFLLDTHPPTIVIQSPAPGSVANGNPTITGQVTDATSGVASFQEAVDGGAYAPLTFDPSTGNFTFTTALPLDGSADGPHTVTFQATDKAGNVSPAVALSFTLVTISQLPTPVLDPASDSGPGQDGITNVTTPLIHEAAPTGLNVSLFVDGQLTQQAISVKGSADFTLGPLADGTYSLVAAVAGLAGSFHSNSKPLSITILTTPPPVPTFDLAAGTADLGPEDTDASHVTLVGQAGPGDTVTLEGTSLSGLASGNGTFQIPGVTLVAGANVLTLQAEDQAGNTTNSAALTVTYTPPSNGLTTNAVIVWNQATLNAIQTDGTDPLMASRALAMVQAAVYDAVNNVEGTPAYYVKITAPADSSVNAAVDAAAHDVLGYLYPAQQATFDALLTSQLALLPSGQGTTDGETVGQAVGNAIIALRENDGSTSYVDFEPGTAPGDWQPTAPAFAPALDPQGADMTPWAMTSDSQFDPAGPPALTSQQWANAVNQVESLGAVNSTTRTAAETKLAQFWNDGIGTPTPAGHWNAIAQTVAEQEGDSLVDDARLFAELDVSMADAGIATWNTKFLYDTWRPVTVIQSGGDGVNPAVTADPTWTSFLTNPNFPEYVSGHSAFSMAAATVLDSFFGDNVTFTTTEPTTTLSLTYTSFDQAATDAGMSRLYGGIHFLFSIQDGWALGAAVARWDLATFSVSKDTTPPKVNLNDVLPSKASNTNVTITGQVTDNLSGVAALAVQVDGGAYAPLPFDATTGNFSFTTSFALDGSADGSHTINFQATNNAGIVAAPVPFTFTLATRAPTLTLTSPTDDGTLAAGATLTGTVTSDAAIVCLCYAFDGSTTMMPVTFNADGTFSQALDLSNLAAGSHTLVVEAQDAAGNTTTQTLNLTMAAPIPLTVTSITPADGSTDIGVTFRPEVFFSRPIDTTTLNSSNFYATDTTGAVIPATIVPSDDGTYAWLFFTNPMPGASTITLVVNGATIKATDDSLLDAADDGTPGSVLTATFTTVSTAPVAGTTLSGIVADPGPDDQPGTRDDVRVGPSGVLGAADTVYLRPIEGVEVYIIGAENQAVTTNAQGQFSFTSVPSGDVKLVVEGNVPGVMVYDPAQQQEVNPNSEGFYFPQMTLDLTIQPGVANTVMGSMGTTQEMQANAANPGVYLPRIQTSILQTVSATQPTTVGVTGASGLGLTPQQQQELTLTVQPNSAVGPAGQKMSNVQVGISTVPPQIVMDMLPTGVMQHTFDITIQAPGVTTFSTPAQLTFPNVFDAAPGTQLNVLSFDHTTGRLVIDGTATVSPDGLTVVTDPGDGVTQPGWHGLTPPGGPSSPPCPPSMMPTVDVPPVPVSFGLTDQFFTSDGGSFQFGIGNAAAPIDPNQNPCSMTNTQATPLEVTLTVDGPAASFLNGMPASNPFELYPGQNEQWSVSEIALLPNIKMLTDDQFYAAQVHIVAYPYAEPLNILVDQTFTVARYEAVVDPNAPSLNALFLKTEATGSFVRTKDFDYHMPTSVVSSFTPSGPNAGLFSLLGGPITYTGDGTANWTFTPTAAGTFSAPVTIQVGSDTLSQMLTVMGTGVAPTTFGVNIAGLTTALNTYLSSPQYFNGTAGVEQASAQFQAARTAAGSDAAFVTSITNDVLSTIQSIYAAIPSITVVSNGGPVAVVWQVPLGSLSPGQGAVTSNNPTLGSPNPGFKNTPIPTVGLSLNDVLFSTTLPLVAKAYAFGEGLQQGGTITVSLADLFHDPESLVGRYAGVVLSHELGHSLGLEDAYEYNPPTLPYTKLAPYDIMSSVNPVPGIGFGAESVTTLQYTTGIELDAVGADTTDALHVYETNWNGSLQTTRTAVDRPPDLDTTPVLIVSGQAQGFQSGDQLSAGTVLADGPGGQSISIPLTLYNWGGAPLTLSGVQFANGNVGFSISGMNPAGTTLAPGASITLNILFDPSVAGFASDTLTITSNDPNSPFTLILNGNGLTTQGQLSVSLATDPTTGQPNNNFGGATVGGAPVTKQNFVTVTDAGGGPLTVSQVQVTTGVGQYAVSGLPAGFDASHPLVLDPGQSFSFNVTFTPSGVGLQRGGITIVSNDPNDPNDVIHVTGTGMPQTGTALHYGNDYVAIEFPNLPGAEVLRAISDNMGNFQFFLPPKTAYHLAIFDPISGLIANSYGTTAASGQTTMFLTPQFQASTAPDSGGDGLPDDVEFAIGLSPTGPQIAADGIDDFTHVIIDHTNPLAGTPVITGVLASLGLQGQASAVTLQGSPNNSQGQTAYVATGTYGLAIVDATQFQQPTVLGQIQLPGDSTSVGVDPNLQIAAVASGNSLNLVNVSNPTQPILLQTINTDATQVVVSNGVAYAAVGDELHSYDLLTGEQLQSLVVSANPITGLARDGSFLYTMDSGDTLHVVDISGPAMVLDGSVTLPAGGGQLFVGGGIAYVAVPRYLNTSGLGALSGYMTVNVSNPNSPTYLNNLPTSDAASQAVAVNGSGLAVTVGSDIDGPAVNVFNSSNTSTSGQFITRFALPAAPLDVAIGEGIAFVADGSSGLQVVNYEAFDTNGVPPTATISLPTSEVVGMNGTTAEVVEGSTLTVVANVASDVQVRNVELLVNGQVVQNVVAFPFDLSTVLPTIAQNGPSPITVQVSATDTGGNVGLSNVLTLQLVRDTIPPTLVSTNVPNGSIHSSSFHAITLLFSKPLNPATVTAANFQLVGPGGIVQPVNIGFLINNSEVQLTYPTLAVGSYQLQINAAAVTDRPGNALGAGTITNSFGVSTYSAVWINTSSGFWDVASNWDSGKVPGPGDDVFIDVPGNVTITYRTGTTEIRSLTSENAFTLSGGTLRVDDFVEVDNTFTLAGGTLQEADVLRGSGGQGITFTSSGGTLNGVTANGPLNLTASSSNAAIVNGLTLNATATLGQFARLDFNGTQTLAGNGSVFFQSSGYSGLLVGQNSTTLTLGAGITVDGGSSNNSTASGAVLGYSGEWGGGSATTVINLGTIAADTAATFLQINVNGTFTNQGSLQALNGGTLNVNGPWSNAAGASVTATASTLNLGSGNSVWSNLGSISASTSTVNLGGSFTLAGLGTFTRSGGTVNLTGSLDASASGLSLTATTGSWNLVGGTLLGGTYSASGGAELAFTSSGGTLNGVTANSPLDLTASSSNATIVNGLTLNATATLGQFARLDFNGTQTLAGNGSVFFQSSGYSGLLVGQNSTTLTLGAGITVDGGSSNNSTASGAVLGYSGEWGGGSATTVINLGTIAADTAATFLQINVNGTFTNQGSLQALNGGTLNVNGPWSNAAGASVTATASTLNLGSGNSVWSNPGSISASTSTVNLGGSFTLAGLGTFTRSGGTVSLTGSLDASASGLSLTATTGSWNLVGGTLLGGTYSASGGAELAFTSSGGTLNGVTANSPLDLTASSSNATIVNGLTLNATATLGQFARLYFNGTQTLAGSGSVFFQSSGYSGLLVGQNSTTLTLGAGITVDGGSSNNSTGSGAVIGYSSYWGGGSATTVINLGTIAADTAATFLQINVNGTFTNQGSLQALNGGTLNVNGPWSNAAGASVTATASTLNLGSGSSVWSNPGSISASTSTVNLGGSFTLAGLGTFTRSGGTVNLTGSLDASASGLSLNASTGSWNLLGGTLLGGTYSASGGAELVFTSSGGTLNGVTANSPLDLTASSSNATIVNGLTLNATATLGQFARLYFNGTQTLAGSGSVFFQSGGYSGLLISQSNTTLTIGAGITVDGGSSNNNTASGAVLGYSNEWGGGSATTVINLGTIAADTAATFLQINANGTFTNQGTLQALNGGTLNVNGPWSNAAGASVTATASTLNLGSGSSVWSNPGNISASTSTVNLGGSFTLAGLGTFTRSGGTVNLTGSLDASASGLSLTANTGSWNLVGGTLLGGTYTAAGGAELAFTSSGGTLNGVTANSPLDLTASSSNATIVNGLTLNATATLGQFARLDFNGTQTLAGSGSVFFQSGGYSGLLISQSNTTLTIGAGITVDGGSSNNNTASGAVLGYSNEWGGGSATTLINLGTIAADTATTFLQINANGTFTNQGTLQALNGGTLNVNGAWSSTGSISVNNGTLNLGGSFTQASLGNFTRSGGTVNLTGTLDDSGSGLALNSTTGSWNLAGGTLLNGTYSASGGAELVFTSSGGTLNGVTANSPLDLTASSSNATIVNGLTLNATATLGQFARLDFNGTQTLAGSGNVFFQSGGYNGLLVNQNSTTLTIGAGITVDGGSSNNNTSSGAVIGYSGEWGGGSSTTLINLGTIAADTAATFLQINPNGTFTNQGTLQASNGGTLNINGAWSSTGSISINNGTLDLGGSFGQASLGNFTRSGGTVNLTGTLDDSGSGLALNSTTGSWNLTGGTLLNGTYSASGGAELVFTSMGGTLNGVTANSPLDLTASSSNATVVNGLTLNATATLGQFARLDFNGTQTLAGSGNVFFQSGGYNGLLVNQNSTTLTIGAGITVDGGSSNNNTSSGAVLGYSGEWGGGSSTTLINLGTIAADTAATFLQINPNGTFSNQGSLQALNGGTLNINGAWSSTGSISTNNGTLDLGGSFTQASLGNFTRSGGTVNLTGSLDDSGSGLALNSTTGSWNLAGGTLLNGTYSASGGAELVFTSTGGTLNGVTANSPLDLTASSSNATVVNGLTLNATATLGQFARLDFSGTQTLAGSGSVFFQSGGYNGLLVGQSNTTLTIGAGITVDGGSSNNNTSSGAVIGYSGEWGGGSATAVINLGTIAADTAATFLQINPNGTFTNQGTLQALNGGSLILSSIAQNTGTLSAGVGSTIAITGPFTNGSGGVIDIALGGTSSSQIGTIKVSGAATLSGTLNIGLANGFTPTSGQSFPVMSWASESGSFGTVNDPAGATFTLSYDSSGLTLVAD